MTRWFHDFKERSDITKFQFEQGYLSRGLEAPKSEKMK